MAKHILGAMSPTMSRDKGSVPGSSRLLLVSDERGWPQTSGYRRRTSQILTSLAELGPTTWVVGLRNRYDSGDPVAIPDNLMDRIEAIQVGAPTRPAQQTARRWLTGNLPWPLAAGDWRVVDIELGRIAQGRADRRFDLIWAMGLDALHSIRRAGLQSTVTIVDADLESLKLHRQLEHGSITGPARRIVANVDRRRWTRLEQEAAATTSGFSVCSDHERRLLGGRAFVTPNSYPLVSRAGGSTIRATTGADQATVLLFVGSLGYGANLDGLRWFLAEVFPRLRHRVPGTRLRIVGSGGDDTGWLAEHRGVELLGAVDDIGAELAAAAALVVPILWGAGTRIKILEAFAHRVPVVSTTVGAEGLDVETERELLIADDAEDFAAACQRVAADGRLAQELIDQAHRTLAAKYEESVVTHRLTDRLSELLASTGS